jgi:uncharacterized protein (DUF1499 family)
VVPALAFLVTVASLVLLAAAPVSWRLHLLPLKVSFTLLMDAGLVGKGAAFLAALGLVLARRSLSWIRVALLSCVILLGLTFTYVPWHLRQQHTPPINDITTDTANPPAIVAALPARQAEQAVSAVYGGPSVAEKQAAAYPDIAPVIVPMPMSHAFELAFSTAKAMPGWQILAVDPQAGTIEATQASLWFGFVDDIVVRVTPDGDGSRIDIRSHSRQGRGDLGVNAARIRKYIAALRSAAG